MSGQPPGRQDIAAESLSEDPAKGNVRPCFLRTQYEYHVPFFYQVPGAGLVLAGVLIVSVKPQTVKMHRHLFLLYFSAKITAIQAPHFDPTGANIVFTTARTCSMKS